MKQITFDRILASFIFFTRLPFWRLRQPPKENYAAVVEYWPLTGWLTGTLMAATLWVGSLCLPYFVAVVLAVAVRMLLTGALHEDGLADFFDGFGGGGSDRSRILAIMKDSHIGTYGVLGLAFYLLLLIGTLVSLPPMVAVVAIIAADPFSKLLAAQMVVLLPYARSEEEAKNKTVYRTPSIAARVSLAIQGLLPAAVCFLFLNSQFSIFNPQFSILSSLLSSLLLILYIRHRLRGYTGDCCGAVCLMAELTFYLTSCVVLSL